LLTYSENGAASQSWNGISFCKPNEKIQDEGYKKNPPPEREERGQECKKPGIDPAIIGGVTRRFHSKGYVPRTLPGDGIVCGITYDFERIVRYRFQSKRIDPVVETKSETRPSARSRIGASQ